MAGEDLLGPNYGERGPPSGEWTNDNANGDPIDRRRWGGVGRRQVQRPDGRWVSTESGADREVNRYRQMGADAANRTGVAIDFGRADNDRNAAGVARQRQYRALDMMEGAARGTAPSRAEIMGKGMIDDSIDASMAVAASSRGGPLASADAMGRAQTAGATTRARGLRDLTALRAEEMRAARTDFMGGATGIRGQDYVGAEQGARMGMAQAEQEARQRALNQQGQQYYEQLGFGVNEAELHAGLATAGMDASSFESAQQRRMSQANADRQFWGSVAGGGADTLGDYAKYSDPAGKTNIRSMSMGAPWMPPGSLPSRTMPTGRHAPMGADPADVETIRGGGYDPNDVDAIRFGEPAPQELLEDRYNAAGRAAPPWLQGYQAPIIRENPYGEAAPPPATGDISRDDPYKTSDERAKAGVAAASFLEGRKAALRDIVEKGQPIVQDAGTAGWLGPAALVQDAADRPRHTGSAKLPRDVQQSEPVALGKPPMSSDKARATFDEGAKKSGVEAAPPAQMMDQIGPGKTFQYKAGVPGEDPNKPQFGTTTQDLRKTPMGSTMVAVDPNTGLEQIDVREAVGPILASLGNLNMRLRAQEYPKVANEPPTDGYLGTDQKESEGKRPAVSETRGMRAYEERSRPKKGGR